VSLSFARLVDWVEGRLSDAEAHAVAEQVAGADAQVQANVSWLRSFRAISQRTVLAAPPDSVRAPLLRRFDEYARSRRGPSIMRQLAAALTFDSLRQPAGAGLRGGGIAPRQMLYATDLLDVALHIHQRPADQSFDISGQVFPKDRLLASEFEAQLLRGPQAVAEASVDDLGEFAFRALQPGRYEIALANTEYQVVLSQIELLR
jgi:hypothetical protein